MIGIIGALSEEVTKLRNELTDVKVETISGMDFYQGKINEKEVVIVKCGVGKVFAAMCTQTMILKYNPELIINIGVSGSLSKGLNVFDLVIGESAVQYDMDTSGAGDPIGMISGIEMIYFPTDKETNLKLEESIKKVGINYKVGVVGTGDLFVSSSEKKDFIVNNFGAITCEMEGAAIAHVCYVNNTKFSVLRSISDGADETADFDYPSFLEKAADNNYHVMLEFLK